MPETDRKLLRDIAFQYYECGRTQAEIAREFGISRPLISRKLAEARERGIVRIYIDDSDVESNEIEHRLTERFNLRGAKVVTVPEGNTALAVKITAEEGARFLSEYLEPGDRIGFGWGWTLYELSRNFEKLPFSSELVCQLTGSVDNAKVRGYANEIIANMAKKTNAENAFTFPCPVMVDSPIISDTLRHDLRIQKILEAGKTCNKVFVNIALPDESSCLYHAGYIKDDGVKELKEKDAVGSICCRFYNSKGEVADSEIDDRTMGISIEDLKKVDCVLACISGVAKAEALFTALKYDLIDVLVIDSLLANALVDLMDREN